MNFLLNPRLVLSVTGIVVVFILLSLGQEMNRRWQIEREVNRLEQEADTLKKSVVELEHLNQYFRTSDFQERLAREKLNYRAPGEEVVLIPENEVAGEGPVESLEIAKAEPPIALKWWNVFFVDPYRTPLAE